MNKQRAAANIENLKKEKLKMIFLPQVHSRICWRRSKPAKPRNRKRAEQTSSQPRKEMM
jgi:hypothetical protein